MPIQCISYLDEAKTDLGVNRFYTIASLTATKDDYFQLIEPLWISLRNQYGIPDGQNIHFTEIKLLQNPNGSRRYKQPWIQTFQGQQIGIIDYHKLYSFFNDVINFIQLSPISILLTGTNWNTSHNIRSVRNSSHNDILSTFKVPYNTFREHLNLMAYYLSNVYSGHPFQNRDISITKLRFDGDIDLGERDDIKQAYHHTITLGTKHFRPDVTVKMFDEIRFIGKNEVGSHSDVSHSGSEIIDFITSFAARELWQLQQYTTIDVPNNPQLNPMPAINAKTFFKQKLEDTYF